MFLMLTSRLSRDNKSSTISRNPFSTAICKAVLLKEKSKISFKKM